MNNIINLLKSGFNCIYRSFSMIYNRIVTCCKGKPKAKFVKKSTDNLRLRNKALLERDNAAFVLNHFNSNLIQKREMPTPKEYSNLLTSDYGFWLKDESDYSILLTKITLIVIYESMTLLTPLTEGGQQPSFLEFIAYVEQNKVEEKMHRLNKYMDGTLTVWAKLLFSLTPKNKSLCIKKFENLYYSYFKRNIDNQQEELQTNAMLIFDIKSHIFQGLEICDWIKENVYALMNNEIIDISPISRDLRLTINANLRKLNDIKNNNYFKLPDIFSSTKINLQTKYKQIQSFLELPQYKNPTEMVHIFSLTILPLTQNVIKIRLIIEGMESCLNAVLNKPMNYNNIQLVTTLLTHYRKLFQKLPKNLVCDLYSKTEFNFKEDNEIIDTIFLNFTKECNTLMDNNLKLNSSLPKANSDSVGGASKKSKPKQKSARPSPSIDITAIQAKLDALVQATPTYVDYQNIHPQNQEVTTQAPFIKLNNKNQETLRDLLKLPHPPERTIIKERTIRTLSAIGGKLTSVGNGKYVITWNNSKKHDESIEFRHEKDKGHVLTSAYALRTGDSIRSAVERGFVSQETIDQIYK